MRVRRLEPRCVHDHVRVEGEDLLDPIGRRNPHGLAPDDLAGVASHLSVAVYVESDQLEIRVVENRPQTGLSHRTGRPLDYANRHVFFTSPVL